MIAKFQQAVEKAVKGLVAALNSYGKYSERAGYDHSIEKHVTSLLRTPRGRDPASRTIRSGIDSIFSESRQPIIRELSILAPKKPGPGQKHRRNTEYPFDESGMWMAPASEGVFTISDVERFRRVADEVYVRIKKLVSFLRRLRP